MARQPFPNCPLSEDLKLGARKCIWDTLRIIEQTDTKQRVLYQCRFCNMQRDKIEPR